LRPKFDLNQLNLFKKVIKLSICIRFTIQDFSLNLPHLKFLYIRCDATKNVIVNCPKIIKLHYYYNRYKGSSDIETKHPEKIIQLETNLDGDKIECFKNVKILKTSNYNLLNERTLSNLHQLDELYFNRSLVGHFKYFIIKKDGI
jgi:hypothetical protein